MTKTRSEIDDLKAQWKADPCWDIEDTPGFEEHKPELLKYRLEIDAAWVNSEKVRLNDKADELHCSVDLVIYLETLEDKIKKLQEDA
jgi:hypothetical protein